MTGPGSRVLLACDFLLKYTVGLSNGFVEAGCDVELLSRDHDLEFGDESGAMREYVDSTLDERVSHWLMPGRVSDPRFWPKAFRLRGALRGLAPDVVHFQDSVVNDPRLLLATFPRWDRVALTMHDPVRRSSSREPLRQRVMRRRLLSRAALVFVHAEALREQLRREARVQAPIVVVPHGVDAPTPSPLPATPRILMFGRMSRYKGLDVLLDAMQLIWRSAPEAELCVAGNGPLPAHAALEDRRVQVRNEHVPEEDVPGLFASSTCVVLPYTAASQSGVGSLAKQHGRAVVASEVGGLPELVDAGSGRLVPPGSPSALAGALLEILRDRNLAERLGQGAAASVDRGLSWPAVAHATLEAYRRHLPGFPA